MTIAALDAHNLGFAIGTLMIPLIGLILLIVGLVERARSQKQPPPMPPGYFPQSSPPSQFGPPYPPPPSGYAPQAPPVYPPATYTPGAPDYPPPPGHWPRLQRPKPRGTWLIVTGAVILGLSLLGGVVRAAESSNMSGSSTDSDLGRLDADNSLTVGQCVADDEFGQGAPEPIDCSNSIATMELASRGGANADCPDGKGRDDTDYTTLFWEDATMCFAANLIERNCYAVNMENTSEAPFIFEACNDPRATIKVVQRFDGTTDAAQCPTGTKPIAYPQPARLYCIEPAR
jgi:hypothetical protein